MLRHFWSLVVALRSLFITRVDLKFKKNEKGLYKVILFYVTGIMLTMINVLISCLLRHNCKLVRGAKSWLDINKI